MGLLDYLENPQPYKGQGNQLRQQFPKLYGALGGLLGTAPDEFDGSVLDPLTAQVRKGAEMGYLPGLIAGGAPPIKGAAGLGTLAGMFVGKGSKTWDAVQASRAMELEKAGVDARKIWAETGTWKAPDGAWRQEIPDNKVKLKGNSKESLYSTIQQGGTVGDVLPHKKVFDAYPIGGMRAEQYPGLGAAFKPGYTQEMIAKMKSLGVDVPQSLAEKLKFGVNTGKTDVIHELQHAIQQREGWALGGNAASMAKDANKVKGMHPEEAYRRLHGEAEARATQARIPLDATQRRQLFPADSYDVPMDQLIIRKGGAGSQASTGGLLGAKSQDMKIFNTTGLPNKGREVIQSKAESLAQQLRDKGFEVDLQHSGSAAGPSSYLKVYDPQTGRYFDNVRLSGHSKGAFNSAGVRNVASEEELSGVLDSAMKMRESGPSSGLLQQQKIEAEAQRLIGLGVKPRSAYSQARIQLSKINGE